MYCRAIAQYNTANILAHDHRNDLIVNGFGLFASLVSRYCWWLDAAGAIVVALIILRSWVWTAYGNFMFAYFNNMYSHTLGRECPVINLPCPYVSVSVLIEQIQLIVGKTADPAFLKKLTYIALTHHRKILQVDTCTAYHAGNNLFVEVDVVMSPDTPLMVSHDISESLQVRFAYFYLNFFIFCLLLP